MCLAFCLPLPSPMCSVSFVCFSFGFCSLLVSGCCCSSSCRRVDAGFLSPPAFCCSGGWLLLFAGSLRVWCGNLRPQAPSQEEAQCGVWGCPGPGVWFAAPWVTGGLVVRFRCLPPLRRGVSHGLEERCVACLPSLSAGKGTKKEKVVCPSQK